MHHGKNEIVMMEVLLESFLLHYTYYSFLYNCMQILQWLLLRYDVGCCCFLMFRKIPKLKLLQYQFHNSMKGKCNSCHFLKSSLQLQDVWLQ